MRSKELSNNITGVTYLVYINGKPGTKHEDYISARWQVELLSKESPNNKYEIKKEVCQLEPAEPKTITEKWSNKYKRSINCNNPKGFSQRAHCQGRKKKINETIDKDNLDNFKIEFKKFLIFVKKQLNLDDLPKIKIKTSIENTQQPTFGRYNVTDNSLEVGIINRQLMDIFRTTAHEIVHYKQHLDSQGQSISGHTGSADENEANAVAGILMREYGQLRPDLFQEKPIIDEHIVKIKNKYRLVSKKSGRNLGTFDTKNQAKERERQVQYFKHKK